jgi:triphosphatase
MSREIEFKLEVEPSASDRLMRQPWLGCTVPRPERQISVYFDTADGDVRQKGYTLRVRSADGRFTQTVKSLGAGAGMFGRGEWECSVEGPEPDVVKLADTPLAELELGELKSVIQSDVSRTAVQLHELAADLEVDFDEGFMIASGRQLPVSEIEIELLRGQPESAVAIARRIAASVPVKLGVLSKAERGFALADDELGECSKAEPVAVSPEMTVAEGFEAIVTACIRHFRLNEPLVI